MSTAEAGSIAFLLGCTTFCRVTPSVTASPPPAWISGSGPACRAALACSSAEAVAPALDKRTRLQRQQHACLHSASIHHESHGFLAFPCSAEPSTAASLKEHARRRNACAPPSQPPPHPTPHPAPHLPTRLLLLALALALALLGHRNPRLVVGRVHPLVVPLRVGQPAHADVPGAARRAARRRGRRRGAGGHPLVVRVGQVEPVHARLGALDLRAARGGVRPSGVEACSTGAGMGCPAGRRGCAT